LTISETQAKPFAKNHELTPCLVERARFLSQAAVRLGATRKHHSYLRMLQPFERDHAMMLPVLANRPRLQKFVLVAPVLGLAVPDR